MEKNYNDNFCNNITTYNNKPCTNNIDASSNINNNHHKLNNRQPCNNNSNNYNKHDDSKHIMTNNINFAGKDSNPITLIVHWDGVYNKLNNKSKNKDNYNRIE